MLISVQTPEAGGTAYAQFAAQWCQNGNGYLLNDTGTSLDVKIGVAASPITVANGKGIPFKLVYNCNELFVRRTDQATAQVTVEAQVGIEEVPSDGGSGSVAAANINDAGATGIELVKAATPAAGRTALGFGGTVTVAELNAAGDAAKSAMWYVSDCLTVNGPGSLVAWCGRTLTWRTLDDCLLATTSFAAWVNDFIANSNSNDIRGTKGALFASLDYGGQVATASSVNSANVYVTTSAARQNAHRLMITGTNANGYTKEGANALAYYSPSSKPKTFAGARKVGFSAIAGGYTLRLGLGSAALSSAALQAEEETLCLDKGNVLGGLNAGLSANWLGCIRYSSTNQTGSGATSVAPVINPLGQDVSVVRDADDVSMYVAGALVATGVGATTRTSIVPICCLANDGTATTSVSKAANAFCYGYLLP